MLAAPFFFLSCFLGSSFDHDRKKRDEKRTGNPIYTKKKKIRHVSPAESGRREVDEKRLDATYSDILFSLSLVRPHNSVDLQVYCRVSRLVDYQCRVCWMDVGRCVERERECFWLGHQIQCHHSKPLCLIFFSFFISSSLFLFQLFSTSIVVAFGLRL